MTGRNSWPTLSYWVLHFCRHLKCFSELSTRDLSICLSPINPPCLSCMAYVKECWAFYQKEFTNVLFLSYLFTQLTSLASVSPFVKEENDPIRWRSYLCYDIWWPLGMKKQPWDSSWNSADVTPAGKSDKACSSLPAPFGTPSAQGGTLINLSLQVPRLFFLQILWASLRCEGDFAVQRDWHSDVGRMLSRRFGDQSVTLSGVGQVVCERFSLGPLANGCMPVGSTLLVILLF